MPAVYRNTEGHTTVLLWAITESEQQLNALVSAEDLRSAARFRSPARRREHLAWRAALRQIVGDAQVYYTDAGAPYIADVTCGDARESQGVSSESAPESQSVSAAPLQAPFISASHTRGMAAVIVSDGPCAIDTESLTRDLARTSARFISPAELALPTSADPEFPVMIWCAKEALYKFSGRRELDFLTDLQITAADPATGVMTGRIGETHDIHLNILRFGEYIVAYIKGR